MTLTRTTTVFAIIVLIWSSSLLGQTQSAEEIMQKSHLAMYYSADDGLADVKMTIVNSKGKERVREFTMLRMDQEDGGKQMYYTYFRKPSDVSRLTFMVHKIPDASDNRWLYVPAVDLVKRISADDKNSSFVGSDFTYEDVSGRHWSEDSHTLLKEDMLSERAVYVIESVPKEEYDGFSRKVSYIDKQNWLPLKEEYYDKKDALHRVFTAENVQEVDGVNTATVRKMENVKKNQSTTVIFSQIEYNVGVESDVFTERYLKNPPRKFIK